MNKIKNILFLLFIGLTVICTGQSIIYKQFSTIDGLPSSETYDLIQDSLGYVWITTDRGLSRFDGENFKNYNVQDGLPNEVVFHLFKESNHKIWFTAKNKRLYYFDPLEYPIKFKAFELNEQLDTFFIENPLVGHIKRFKHVKNKYYFAMAAYPGYLVMEKNKKYIFNSDKFIISPFSNQPNTEIIINHDFPFLKFNKSKVRNDSIIVRNQINNSIFRSKHLTKNNLDSENTEMFKIETKNDISLIINHKELIIIKSDTMISRKMNGFGLDFVQLKNGHILVATELGLIEFDQNYTLTHHYLQNSFITSVLLDQHNGIWISTLENGIYYIQNLNINELKIGNQRFPGRKLYFNHDLLFILNARSSTAIFKELQLIYKSNNTRFSIRNNFVSSKEPAFSRILQDKFQRNDIQVGEYKTYYIGDANDKYYVGAIGKYIGNKTDAMLLKVESVSEFETYELLNINDSTLYLATEKGIYTYHIKRKTFEPFCQEKFPFFKYPQRMIRKFNNGYILGSESAGIVIFNGQKLINIDKNNGLLDNHPTGIAIENDSTFWVSSYGGINKIIHQANTTGFKIYSFTQSSVGLLSNEITDIKLHHDTIWASTKIGTFYFEKNLSIKSKSKNFHLDSVFINDEKVKANLPFILNFKESLQIFYNCIDFDDPFSNHIEYALINSNDTVWKKVNNKLIHLQNIPDGEMDLIVRSINEKDILFLRKIVVNGPFWLKWDFIILAIILISLVLYMIIQVFVFINDKKRQREIDKIKLEIKALNAQMNPHFTFNTINSIQHYLIKNDIVGGINYLNDYAKIVRKSLEFSRREIIPLQEEIDFLFLYANLEKKRFDKNFNFKFVSKLDKEPSLVFIPSLLLQPIIENAIIHGINATEYKGELTISIKEENKYYLIEIIDNGTGFDHSKVLNSKNSYGLKIVIERLNIYNEGLKIKQPITFEYFDIEKSTGTRVKIRINKHIEK